MGHMPAPKTIKKPTARSAAAAQAAEDRKKRKLHVIAERRAKAQKMTKKDYIAAIVEGRFPGITPADIAAEEDPGVDAVPPA
jgi:hypothetical protein